MYDIESFYEAVSVGDVVEVQVMTVDVDRRRIQLTMKIGR